MKSIDLAEEHLGSPVPWQLREFVDGGDDHGWKEAIDLLVVGGGVVFMVEREKLGPAGLGGLLEEIENRDRTAQRQVNQKPRRTLRRRTNPMSRAATHTPSMIAASMSGRTPLTLSLR